MAWRTAGDYDQDRWKYTDCPQPLKPHGMTWQQLDKVLADKAQGTQAAPVPAAVVPLCDKCHGCGIVARLPSETEIIRRLIHGLRRKRLLHTPLWRRFSDATAHGHGFSVAICARYGFDPDELELPPSAHLPSGPLVD